MLPDGFVPIPEAMECRAAGPITRTTQWRGLKYDDVVLVVDPYWPGFAGIRFRFCAYAYNVENGVGWIEVFGGPKGKQWVRAFPAEAIRIPATRSTTKPN